MNILIIAKTYHAKQSARAIQMRRVVAAFLKYTSHSITLITEGPKNQNFKNEKLQIINIPGQTVRFPFIEKLIDRLVCSPFCLKENEFIKTSTQIANELIAQNKIDLLLTVSTPFDSHIAGLNLKNKNPNLNWITFFSDLFPTCILPVPYYRRKLFSGKEMQLMQQIAAKCDKILTPSEYTLNTIKEQFNVSANLCQIQHCAEETTLENNEVLKGYIVHAGFLTKERIKEDLVIAVKQLANENPNFKGLIHIGNYHPKLKKLIQKHNCKNIFLLGSLPEQLTTKIQQMMEISLIIEAPMKGPSPFMPSKITDSISNSRKVISISPEESFLNKFALQNSGVYSCIYETLSIKKCMENAIICNDQIDKQTLMYFHPETVAKKYNDIFKK
jgi:glycosyltransferase involved in cell wall biosynthesis